jgi:hypothetical protein
VFPTEFSRKRPPREHGRTGITGGFLASRAALGSLVVRGNQAACSRGQGRELNAAAGCGFPIGVKKGRRGRGKEEAESGTGAVVVVSGESDAGRGRREEPRKESLGIWGFCFRFLVPFAGGGG